MQLNGASEPGSLKPTRTNDQCGFKTARLYVCLSGVCHTEIKSFLAGKTSHVLPSPCGVCPEGRRTRVTQWLKTKDKPN